MKNVNVGGQAIMEGVMMRKDDTYSIAIRKPDKEILLEKRNYISFTKRYKVLGLPIIRGAVAFFESLVQGMKILTFSAEFFEVEGEEIKQSKFEKKLEEKYGEKKLNDILIMFAVVVASLFSIGLFIILPLTISQFTKPLFDNSRWVNLIDGLIRMGILLIYMWVISLMKDIHRVFQYHGAEHKSIHCIENELELTVENVKKQSRLHKRCGTNFLFVVVFISIMVLTIVNVETFWLRLMVRLLLLPFIAGLSYEVIKAFGKYESKFVNIISLPGLLLQRLTTREPDDEQIEVAIVALKGALERDVLDDTKSA